MNPIDNNYGYMSGDPNDPNNLIRDPSLNPNMFNPMSQPDFYMAKEMLADDFADNIRARVMTYDWDQSTLNSIFTFLDYLKSQAVVLSNYNDMFSMQRAVLNVKVAFLKQTLLSSRADTNSSEYIAVKDYCFQYLEDKLSRAHGPDRERKLQNPYHTSAEHTVHHDIRQSNSMGEKQGWMDRIRRKRPQQQYEE